MENERPDKYPEWATDEEADIVEPTLGQKQLGWLPDDEPPAGWLNWYQNKVHQWSAYLDEMASMWASNWNVTDIFTLSSVPGGEFSILDIATDGDMTIFVGDSSYIIYTYDFINYAYHQVDSLITQIDCIGFGNGYWFIGCIRDGSATNFYATNPIATWTENDQFSSCHTMKYLNDYWVVAHTGGMSYRATDPTGSFTDISGGPAEMFDFDYSPEVDLWVAVTSAGRIYYCSGTNPGGTWTENDQGSMNFRSVTHGVVNGVTTWVAGAESNEIYTTNDATSSWTLRTSQCPSGTILYSAGFGSGVFLLCGQAGGSQGGYQISRDGINWHLIMKWWYFRRVRYLCDRFILGNIADYPGGLFMSLRHGNLG